MFGRLISYTVFGFEPHTIVSNFSSIPRGTGKTGRPAARPRTRAVDRIGLGSYLYLTLGFPEFNDTIETISDEFRRIKAFHTHGRPYVLPCRVAVLHTWGSLRSWTLSGHFHETDRHALIHINEALSGLPVDVRFISFEDVRRGALRDVDVVYNAGRMGDVWSGGNSWRDAALVSALTRLVFEGGVFIGVNKPAVCPENVYECRTLDERALLFSIYRYMGSEAFAPAQEAPVQAERALLA